MNSATGPVFSMMDLVRILSAILIVAAGALTCLLFLVRLKRKDYSLIYFGLGSLLYGVRLFINGTASYLEHKWDRFELPITLLVGIPLFLFIAETTERKTATKWIVGVVSFVAGFGIASLVLGLSLYVVQTLNHIAVLLIGPTLMIMLFVPLRAANQDIRLLRIGLLVFMLFVVYTNLVGIKLIRGNGNLEFIGFIVFLGCLGFVAASRTQRNEERLMALNKEMEIARGIQAGLLPEKSFSAAGLTMASRYVPASSVAGDFYDFLQKDGGLGVLIADVSGHGVPAALSASMVKVAIRAQRDWADDPARVLTGLNSILCGNLQGQFVTAGYLYLDPGRGALAYAGAGHPPLLAWRGREKKVECMEENGLMLGIFPEGAYKSMTTPLGAG